MLNIIAANFKLGWNYNLNYRLSLFLGTIARILSLMFIIFLWLKIYQGQDNIGGYTLEEMMTYYLFAIVTRNILSPDFSKFIGQRIKDGTMQILLLRPGHPLISLLGFNLAKIVVQFLTFLFFIFIVLPLAFSHLEFVFSLSNILAYLTLVGLGLILTSLLSALVGVIAFWLIEVYPIFYSYSIISNILSGGYVPLALFPVWAKSIFMILPFRYLVYEPVQALQGRLTGYGLISVIIQILIWIIFLFVINRWLWKKGFKRFDAVGN